MVLSPSTKAAIELVTRAVEEDRNRNYAEAVKLYRESEKYFLHPIKHHVKSDRAKDIIRNKCQQYQKRARRLESYLRNKDLCDKLDQLSM